MKKLTLIFLIALLSTLTASAQTLINGIYYNLDASTNTATVTSGSSKYTGSVTIPETVTNNGVTYSVTSIGTYAFYVCSDLTDVNIPNSVTEIQVSAFQGCTGLTSVLIPNSVEAIGQSAFEGTQWLDSQPDGLVYAGLIAYKYKGTMPEKTSIVLKDGTKGIGGNAFHSCSGLISVTIPNGVKSIGENAFYSCSGLTSVTIPSSVKTIGGSAFAGTGLTSVHITDLEAWCKINFTGDYANPLYRASHLYLNGSEIIDLVIPSSVTSINNYAFQYCSGLNSVTIPNSVTSIGEKAFFDCANLTSISIPNSVKTIRQYAFGNCKGLTSIDIPNSVTSLGGYAFWDCLGLTSINLSNSLTILEGSVFAYCTSLTSITIPSSVTTIYGYAFRGCLSLKEIIIPNSVTSISDRAFSGCTALTSVTIPNSVTKIGNRIFERCSNLAEVYCYAENIPSTHSGAFKDFSIENTTLYVPETSFEAYKTTEPWSGFGDIVAMDVEPVIKSIDIDEVSFPDVNFRNWILAQEYGKNGILTGDELANVTSIEVNQNDIQSLKGIENFTALKYLICGYNQLTSLDVSNNTALKYLYCYCNQIVDKEMDALVASLPTVSYGIMEVIINDVAEGNVMTTTQVAAAKVKGWRPMCYDGSNWQEYAGSEPVVMKCATPTINFADGKVTFSCETEGVKYISNITPPSAYSGDSDEVSLRTTYIVTVYATKDGYENSNVATKEINVSGTDATKGDVNEDGQVNGTDIQEVINIIVNAE